MPQYVEMGMRLGYRPPALITCQNWKLWTIFGKRIVKGSRSINIYHIVCSEGLYLPKTYNASSSRESPRIHQLSRDSIVSMRPFSVRIIMRKNCLLGYISSMYPLLLQQQVPQFVFQPALVKYIINDSGSVFPCVSSLNEAMNIAHYLIAMNQRGLSLRLKISIVAVLRAPNCSRKGYRRQKSSE